jgi:hypothetical protein
MDKKYKEAMKKYIVMKFYEAVSASRNEAIKDQYKIDLSSIELNGTRDGDHLDVFDSKGKHLGDAFFTPDEDHGNQMACYFTPRNITLELIRQRNRENYSDMIPEELITPKNYSGKSDSRVKIYKISHNGKIFE